MKILFITRPIAPPWNEGSKNSVLALARQLRECEVHLLTAKGFKVGEKHIVSEEIFTQSGLVSGRSFGQKLRLLLRLFKRDDIDIYHFFFKPTALVAMAAKLSNVFNRKETVQTIVSVPREGEQVKKSIFSKNLVVGSKFMQARLKEKGLDSTLIPFGVDPQSLKPLDVGAAKKGFGLAGSPTILFPGDLFSGKGLDTTVESMPSVLSRFSNAKFVFACRLLGTEEEKRALEAAKLSIKASNFEKNSWFVHEVDDMRQLVAASDIVVFPARVMHYKMDYPLVLLEAMALEKPVIFSNVLPLNELFEQGSNIMIEKGNPEELSNAIISLLSDEKERNSIGRNAKSLVQKKFNIQDSAKKYLELYKTILGEAK